MISEQQRAAIIEEERIREAIRKKGRLRQDAKLAFIGFAIFALLQIACWFGLDLLSPAILLITILGAIISLVVWVVAG